MLLLALLLLQQECSRLYLTQAFSQRSMYLWQECVCVCNFLHYYYNVHGHPFYYMLLLSEYFIPYQAGGVPQMLRMSPFLTVIIKEARASQS